MTERSDGWIIEDDYDLDDKIRLITSSDDSEKLISLMKFAEGRYRYSLPDLLTSICMCDSMKCATALLEGKLGITVNDVNMPVRGECMLLHHAARSASPKLIQLFLSHGARSDIRWYHEFDRVDEYNGFLPLNLAIDRLRMMFTVGQSTFLLLVAVCLPQTKQHLAAIKLLAQSSKDVEMEAYHYAMEGKFIELVALLIVAREKVLVPITFHRKGGAGLSGSITLRECLKNQILSLLDEEIKLMAEVKVKVKHWKLTQIHRKRMVMRTAALVLEVFERAGNTIEEYLQSQQPGVLLKEQVEKDIAWRLAEAGFKLKGGDFDFSIREWINSCDSVRTPINYIQTPLDKSSQLLSPPLPMLQQTDAFSPPKKVIPGDGHWSSISIPPLRKTYGLSSMGKSININQVPESIHGSQYSTSVDAQLKKGTKSIGQNVPKCLSREKSAYIAMLIKRRMRSA